MTVDMNRFGKNLDRIIKDRNMSQTELAKVSGVSRVAISHWICNRNMPRLDCVAMIVKALGISFDDLMEGVVQN